jgi:hypothetical protein
LEELAVKVKVIYDPAGEILAILQAAPVPKKTGVSVAFGVDPGPGQLIADVELAGELANKSLSEIHETHCIDIKAKKLMRRGS